MSLLAVWPWAIAIAVVGLVICVVIAVIVLRASRAKVPMVPASVAAASTGAGSVAASPSGPTSALTLRRSFAEAMRALKAQTSSASERLAVPWVLSIGEAGAGKSVAIESLPLARLPGVTQDSSAGDHAACTWSFFEQGIVLDVAGALVLDPSSAHTDDRAWQSLIAQLQHYRPERPLDAVMLSIPATDLVGPTRLTKQSLAAKAGRLGDRLAELQHALSLRLPVYVLITKCDRVPGFTALCRALPAGRLDNMCGWSSPYAVDSAFAPAWVDEALDAVLTGIQEAEFAVLAREETPAEGSELFLLPLHLDGARSPLREFLQRVFRDSSYERGEFLRGIFFTGDKSGVLERDEASVTPAPAFSAAPASAAIDPWLVPIVTPPVASANVPSRQPVFLRDLFADKIFAERGLARPGPRVFPSKNRTVAIMQVATAIILLFGPLALYAAVSGVRVGPWRLSNGIRAEEASIRPLLQNIDLAVRQMHTRRQIFHAASNDAARDVSVFHLLDNMASLSTNHMWSVFLPGTLISPLHRDITDAIGLSFQLLILPEFRNRMLHRSRRLFDPSTRPVPGDEHFAVGLSLPAYLTEVDALGTNIARYNDMSQAGNGGMEDLVAIVHYLYGEEMAPGFLDNDGYYRRALTEAHATPIHADSLQMSLALRRAGELTRASYLALLERLSHSTVDADSADESRSSRADVEALVGLRTFLDTAGPVEHALAGIHQPFFFGDNLARDVRDTLAFYTQQLTGQVLPRYADAAHSTEAVTRALDALLHQQFMQAPAGRSIDAGPVEGADLSWDGARLDEALALQTDFDKFIAHGLDPLPETLRNRVRRLATAQLAAAMTEAIAGSVRTRASSSMLADGDRDLTARITAFGQNAARIDHLLELLDAIGATTAYDALSDLSTSNANALLARVDASLDLANRYRLSSTTVRSWNGRAPFSATAFGGRPGALDDFVASEEDAFRSAARLARPLVAFLEARSVDGARRPARLRTWDAILGATDKLDHKPASGPLIAIEAMLRTELDSIDVRSCARQSPRSSTESDVFGQLADAMWSAVWRRCADVAERDLVGAYARLEGDFRRRLAGRFPFAAADAPSDAAVADVVEVLHNYDAFVANARQTTSHEAGPSLLGTRADAFIADMAKVRAFLAPLVDSAATGRLPTFDYQLDFRVNRPHEFGANQIAEWSGDVADQHSTIGALVAARRGRWRAGDDVRVTLRWATGSQFIPAEPVPPGGSLTTDGSLSVSASGEWSLLRLLRQHESDVPDPDGGQTMKITIHTVPRVAPASAGGTARVFLRVRLYSPDSKTELALPRFPASAPDISGQDRR